MRPDRIIVIGTSAGGIDALRSLVAELPADFPAPLAAVIHVAPESPGVLHEILGRATRLKAVTVHQPTPLSAGTFYLAAPDYHLVVEPGRLRATRGPKENRFRPAIDPLFRSAAQVFGPAAIGVILTGNLDDGVAGLATIKQLGGTTIVQDPAEAAYPSMPENALRHVQVHYKTTLAELAPLLNRLAAMPPSQQVPFTVPELVNMEVNIAKEQHPRDTGFEAVGTPSPYACPECHGVLLQVEDGGRVRFRCHTGHAYSTESLIADVDEGIQVALWNAVRALEEAMLLIERIAGPEASDGTAAIARRARELRRQSDALRAILSDRDALIP